jgi:phosphopantetheinyl transferase (holo-ACP synthase)
METEFIYCRRHTPVGIRIEEITGGEDKSGRVWDIMSRQVYAENGKEGGYRPIEHYDNGAPYVYGMDQRISLSHTKGMLVVATLPRTPEVDLSKFSLRTAMGIDVERADRAKVLDVREKFLSETELAMIDANDIEDNIIAWTAKEAMYKAAWHEGMDWVRDMEITKMPDPRTGTLGEASVCTDEEERTPMLLYSYLSDDFLITVAFSPKCATFKKEV